MTRKDDRQLLKAAYEAWDAQDWAVAGERLGGGIPERRGGRSLPASRDGDHTASGSVLTYA